MSSDDPLKFKVSRVYSICRELWPDEFDGIFTARREEFRDWLNSKTGLEEDHMVDKSRAIVNWLNELEELLRRK